MPDQSLTDAPEPLRMPAAAKLAGGLWLAAGAAFFAVAVALIGQGIKEGIDQAAAPAYYVYVPLLIAVFYGGPGALFLLSGVPTWRGTAKDITAPAYFSFACAVSIMMCRTLPLMSSLLLPESRTPWHLIAVYVFELLLAVELTVAGILAMASRPAYMQWRKKRYHIEKPTLAKPADWQANPPLATAVDSDPDFDFGKP